MSGRPGGKTRVAVVGGGLAGLAAAAALKGEGLDVEVFEARPRLGGRAGSFVDPQSGELVDHGQHVAMGCCVNLADLCRRTGLADGFLRHRRLHFIAPGGRRWDFAPWTWLPGPLHLLPPLLRFGELDLRERWGIVQAAMRLARRPDPAGPDETIGGWLRRHGQSPRAIEWLWKPVLVSALSETLDRASLAAARKVIAEGFLASPRACEVLVPRAPLAELFDRRLGAWLGERGAAIRRGVRVRRIEGGGRRAAAVVLPDGSRQAFDFFVVAADWRQVRGLFPEAMLAAMPQLSGVGQIAAAPITAVHLWFDRPITSLPHAVLRGRLSQWLFAGQVARLPGRTETCPTAGGYCQVVISASHELKGGDRPQIVGRVVEELKEAFPAAREGALLRWRMLTEPSAVFSVRPGLDALRPAQATPIENLVLAGDWTATGWPATLEGAVRSGYLAAEAVLRARGTPRSLLVPDLPRGRWARWLLGRGG